LRALDSRPPRRVRRAAHRPALQNQIRPMNIIGGVVYRDPTRAPDRGALASCLSSATDPARALWLDLSGAVLAGVGTNVISDRAVDAAALADLDLTNGDDLHGISGGTVPGRWLQDLYAQFGVNFVARLRGAFALAIWVPKERRLVLAADRFGFR